nr:DUF1836 domain-containing protein [Dubosiella newyorkensis]
MQEIYQKIQKIKLPLWEDFPNMDLYVDQVVSYINQTLSFLDLEGKEMVITKSMVNNYVKHSMVPQPIKKYYKPYHVGYLIVVCILKCCFSLKDISKMINIYRNMKDDHIELHYNRFTSIFEKNLKEIFLSNTLPNLTYESPSPEQQLMESTIRTVVYKIYSQSLLHSMSE